MTRDAARALRKAIAPDDRAAWSGAITDTALRWAVYQRARTVMAYVSVGGEVGTEALLRAVLADGKRLVLPRCEGHGVMHGKLAADLQGLVRGRLGIPEPPAEVPTVDKDTIDLIFVPGLLFDRDGNRLGQGAGYYDRYLADYRGVTCGLAFSVQVVAALAARPHDIPVQALITEQGFCRVGGAQAKDKEGETCKS